MWIDMYLEEYNPKDAKLIRNVNKFQLSWTTVICLKLLAW